MDDHRSSDTRFRSALIPGASVLEELQEKMTNFNAAGGEKKRRNDETERQKGGGQIDDSVIEDGC